MKPSWAYWLSMQDSSNGRHNPPSKWFTLVLFFWPGRAVLATSYKHSVKFPASPLYVPDWGHGINNTNAERLGESSHSSAERTAVFLFPSSMTGIETSKGSYPSENNIDLHCWENAPDFSFRPKVCLPNGLLLFHSLHFLWQQHSSYERQGGFPELSLPLQMPTFVIPEGLLTFQEQNFGRLSELQQERNAGKSYHAKSTDGQIHTTNSFWLSSRKAPLIP